MLFRLADILGGTRRPTYPSVLLVLRASPSFAHGLHIVPETGVVEQVGGTQTHSTFSLSATKERSREQVDKVVLHVGDGENRRDLLNEVATQATQLLGKREESGYTVYTVEQSLRSAVLEILRKKSERQ